MSTVNRLTSSFGPSEINNMPENSIWTPTVIIATVLFLASGTMNTIGFAIQGDKYEYKHGVCQTALMFLGEYVNLFILNLVLVSSLALYLTYYR